MRESDWAKNFSLGTLANEVEFAIEVYKSGTERISEGEKRTLLAGKDLLEEILNFEKEGRLQAKKGAYEKLELLKNSSTIIDAWTKSEVLFPKNDIEYRETLQIFIQTLRDMAERKEVEAGKVNNIEKLFSTLGEIMLRKVHKSSCR